jgi:hypothetical protein
MLNMPEKYQKTSRLSPGSVEFDPSKRKKLDPSCLDGLALPIEGSGKEGA